MDDNTSAVYSGIISTLLPGSSMSRKILEVKRAPEALKELVVRSIQGEGKAAIRYGPGPDDVFIQSGEYTSVPRVPYSVDVAISEDTIEAVTAAILRQLGSKERQIIFPVLNEAMNESNQLMECPSWADPYQIMAAEATSLLKANGFSYGNIISVDENGCVLCAKKEQLGTFVVFEEWGVVSYTSDTITFAGVFGCIIRPRALVGVVRKAKV